MSLLVRCEHIVLERLTTPRDREGSIQSHWSAPLRANGRLDGNLSLW